jgi:ribosomal protein L11 methylase PrmA
MVAGRDAPRPDDDAHVVSDPASFRDPAGFVYRRDGVLLRQIDHSFGDRWDRVVESGLLARLEVGGELVPHEVAALELAADPAQAHAVIRPTEVAFVSYPVEWSFGMLRDAALLTLDVQAKAMAAGFTLRDASAYNVLFDGPRPILIDHLSFEAAAPGTPWAAYRQFCEHFLAPLALMARRDVRLGSLLRSHLDGIPLDLAAHLLPWRSRFSPGLGPHIHLHARGQRQHADGGAAVARETGRARVGRLGSEALIDSLRRTVAGLDWTPAGTEWADYDQGAGTDDRTRAMASAKDDIVRSMLVDAGGSVVWDLGANVGRHSAIAAELGRRVVSWDADPAAVERHYRALRSAGSSDRVLPLLADLADPTPSAGWALRERRSMLDRADADVALALALIHHLAIGRNVPLPRIADLFASLAPGLIVEWVGRDDPMVARLLATREDVFRDYDDAGFRAAFGRRFRVAEERALPGSGRVLFRMERLA